MTKRMEEFFNLPPSVEPEAELPVTQGEIISHTDVIDSSLTTAEKIDIALPLVRDLETHDSEMDDIASKAVKTFEDLIALGGNVPDLHAGKIYEVAGQMLKTALDAKNSKAERKLKIIELQLKKVRAEQIDFENGNSKAINSSGGEFDRNELLKHLVSSKLEKSDK